MFSQESTGAAALSANSYLADLDSRVELAVAGFRSGILSPAELLHDQFRALGDREHLGGDVGRFEGRSPDLQAVLVAVGQHFIEAERFTAGEAAVVDVDFLTFVHFELASAIFDDCVHGGTYSTEALF